MRARARGLLATPQGDCRLPSRSQAGREIGV
eukprot:CAMPEP_0175690462 /NCGR_PEP_ID=MMETSP0097-20121207/29905_1 /TAXON_ID=311494 /ORGANISM="Alexandrium monilatum, Strain CCMP3105" /LENGTH=30 /DNA_ID= /DNA_START= /DNA_END= /DNA_ORIENTATION=